MNTDETSDNDIDWEKVAADMDKLEESKGPKITKQAKFKLWKSKSAIKLVLTTNETEDVIHTRGEAMIEQRHTLQTPVRIEFNLEASIAKFNVIKSGNRTFW